MLIQGNRVTRSVCRLAVGAGAWAFFLLAPLYLAADETESNSSASTDGAVVAGDAAKSDEQAVEQPGAAVGADHSGAGNGEAHPDAGEHPDARDGHGGGGGHGDGGHHDPFDLSQANATPKLEDPSEWRYDMALCTFAVFMLLLLLLRAFAWRPIMAGLERRESAIATRIEEAERDAAEAATQLQAYRDKLAAAAQEAQEIVTRARRDAEAVAEKVRSEAAADAVRERQRALADIESAKKVALREIAERGADVAVGLAGRIVGRELNSQDHAELIRETLGQFPSNN